MRKRIFAVLFGALLLLALGSLGCSVSGLVARRSGPTATPTRTPRPTWTREPAGVRVATPTLDSTRFPGVTLPTEPPPTAQVLVPGGEGQVFVPVPEGGSGVQTVVVIIVTATPPPPPTGTPGPPTPIPPPPATPGPPTATPTITPTPLPPVVITVKVDKANVRQGPGTLYPAVTRLDIGTEVTVVGRNANGDWWKICCVNGADVWIADSVVTVQGPLWAVSEVTNIPPPPPTAIPTATRAPTPTYAWPFRLEGAVQEYFHGQNWFRVDAIIYNGTTPLYGWKLQVRKASTGQTWLSAGSQTSWIWQVLQYPDDYPATPVNPNTNCPAPRKGLVCSKSNVKWDSNGVGVPMGNDVWEITVVDGAGTPVSSTLRINTSETKPKWYYLVFTNRP